MGFRSVLALSFFLAAGVSLADSTTAITRVHLKNFSSDLVRIKDADFEVK